MGLKCEGCGKYVSESNLHGDYYFCPHCNDNYSADGLPEDVNDAESLINDWEDYQQ